jgi:cyclopropane-fatty-acyl-phospholipid synthase
MGQCAATSLATGYDRIFRRIQKRVADKLHLPIEIQIWGGHVYRIGKGEPAVKILVENRQGLAALLRLDEVKSCEAYMNGSFGKPAVALFRANLIRNMSNRMIDN